MPAVNRRTIEIVALVLVAGAFFAGALSGDVYEATSPVGMHWHTIVRKLYSIVAFAAINRPSASSAVAESV